MEEHTHGIATIPTTTEVVGVVRHKKATGLWCRNSMTASLGCPPLRGK